MDYITERISQNYLTPQQAALRLMVSPSTIYRLVREREIEVVRVGRLVRIRPQALEDYCERTKVGIDER